MSAVKNVRLSGLATIRASIARDQRSKSYVRLSDLREARKYEQVAAVCYREREQGIEFLLVRTRGSGRWTFPKGGVEPGLTHAQAAALEAFEEAGVHGRMENDAFTRYVCRKRSEGKSTRSKFKNVILSAHLCQVLRLAPPKESERDRTWFSAKEARRQLKKGRDHRDAAEFARVVDQAIVRIEKSQKKTESAYLQNQSPREQVPRDALQKVQFEAAPGILGWGRSPSSLHHVEKLGPVQPSHLPASQPRKLLPGDVLPFSRAHGASANSDSAKRSAAPGQRDS